MAARGRKHKPLADAWELYDNTGVEPIRLEVGP